MGILVVGIGFEVVSSSVRMRSMAAPEQTSQVGQSLKGRETAGWLP